MARAGPFQLQRLVARRPAVEVYDAFDERFQSAVRLQLLQTGTEEKTRRRFDRQAQALMRVEHEHVVMLHDFGVLDDGRAYVACEPVEGAALGELVTERGPMDAQAAMALLGQAASGLRRCTKPRWCTGASTRARSRSRAPARR
jgi:eukaryotic-like serine/threonine-protein kinase